MIRPFTLISAVLFVLSGAYLFAVKQHAQVLDNEIASTAQATRLDQQRIRVLQAQWALEADPSRLQQLATQFTTLQPMQPSQLVTLASLGNALPAPGSAAPASNPENAVPPVVPSESSAVQVARADPASAPPAVKLSAPKVVRPPSALVAVKPASPLHLASVESVIHAPAVHHSRSQTRRLAGTHLFAENRRAYEGSSVLAVQSLPVPQHEPMGARVMSVRAVAQITPEAPPLPSGNGGSMLGMAQSGSDN
ncbi:MAG TPA: hypothetical protein PLY97_11895 [Acidocella sp.]|nr:MAG: hypothetical protein B7Z81_11925 [Acidocella sp. 20-61-6]HQT47911.1 hypothetical protein [Acidocella sp.]